MEKTEKKWLNILEQIKSFHPLLQKIHVLKIQEYKVNLEVIESVLENIEFIILKVNLK